ncbi:MAG: hypothetical protein JWL63_1013 [Rhodocyclales bacterium]|nr:hypothetical protein [Rhodocyclales bacterium]
MPLVAAALYFLAAYLMVLFPANALQDQDNKTIDAYAISNGVHVDFVFPVKTSIFDWTTSFPTRDFLAPPASPAYIAIGWGDREFYLNTQNLSDITAGRAFGALAGGHRTLLHVNYLPNLNLSTRLYKLPLSARQYASLIGYVHGSLALASDGQSVVIPGRHYGALDAFYEARGSYNLFDTCNTWIGKGLQQAHVKVSRWTPLDSLAAWHLQPVLQHDGSISAPES